MGKVRRITVLPGTLETADYSKGDLVRYHPRDPVTMRAEGVVDGVVDTVGYVYVFVIFKGDIHPQAVSHKDLTLVKRKEGESNG